MSARAVSMSVGASTPLSSQLPDDLEAVSTREPDVEDQQIGLVLQRARQSGFAIARRADVVPMLAAAPGAGARRGSGCLPRRESWRRCDGWHWMAYVCGAERPDVWRTADSEQTVTAAQRGKASAIAGCALGHLSARSARLFCGVPDQRFSPTRRRRRHRRGGDDGCARRDGASHRVTPACRSPRSRARSVAARRARRESWSRRRRGAARGRDVRLERACACGSPSALDSQALAALVVAAANFFVVVARRVVDRTRPWQAS